ncbi:hypothetical protein Tco_1121487 [Tanacetum coccineum]|uniref:Uncharacterized protein n=1 Tax=Tanacetum coccineum TaxID=301880 RepID=A0ABQ5J016_9ASTR
MQKKMKTQNGMLKLVDDLNVELSGMQEENDKLKKGTTVFKMKVKLLDDLKVELSGMQKENDKLKKGCWSKDVMEEKCGSAAICFLAFPPNMLDSKAEGRNNSVWDAAGKHPSLENHVGVGGYGYPALITLNIKKGAYAPLKSAFEREQITFVLEEDEMSYL